VVISFTAVAAAVLEEVPEHYEFHALWLAPAAALITIVIGLAGSFVHERVRSDA